MHSLRTRLFLVLTATGMLLVLASAALYKVTFATAMEQYLLQREVVRLQDLADRLGERYPEAWFQRLVRPHPGPHKIGEEPPPHLRHVQIVDLQRRPLVGRLPDPEPHHGPGEAAEPPVAYLPIRHGDETVAWLAYRPRTFLTRDSIDRAFESEQTRTLTLTTGIALLIALLVSWPLSRYLVAPIKAMAALTRQLAAGDYSRRLTTGRRDELGALGADINQLALSLEQAARARDRWLADVSHELRTPLAILQGELEALLDGIRPLEPRRLESLHDEILHLRRLIDDLHDLALADAGTLRYSMERVDLSALVNDQLDLFAPALTQKGLQLQRQVEPDRVLRGDLTRLRQLLANLLGNSLKYTDPGGRVRVTLEDRDDHYLLTLDDSAPGVPAASLERIFDHLHREESASRNRERGGSGLGLALARRIVEAHGGRIQAFPSELGGLRLQVVLPRTT